MANSYNVKYNPKGLTHEDLTSQQIKEARETMRCPISGEAMKMIKSQSDSRKNELYCEKSHLSVPAWIS